MKFSIVIVTYNRKKELENCLRSIFHQAPMDRFETIVIFNGELSYLEKTKSSFPLVKCYYTSSVSPSIARNFGISKCQGENILFLDDDCSLPANYFSQIDFNMDWDVFGGPDATAPESSSFQKILGYALASPFCMGKTYSRHSASRDSSIKDANESQLILCNMWVKSKIFTEGHCFEGDLFRNEENFLLKKLLLENKKIKYNPALFVYHNRRNSYGSLASSIMRSGECRVLNFMKLPVLNELIYSLPLIFMTLFFTWMFNISSLLGFIFIPYILIVYFHGIVKTKSISPVYLFMHFFILFMYSLGVFKGFLQHSWLLMKDYSKEYN